MTLYYFSSPYSETVLQHLSELRPAPSVGLQDVPRESMGDHLGFTSQQVYADETDEKLARAYLYETNIVIAKTDRHIQKMCVSCGLYKKRQPRTKRTNQ